MIAYHGSDALFKEFNSEYFSTSTGNEQYGSGFYFISNSKEAELYGNNLYTVNLELKNPYILNAKQSTNNITIAKDTIKKLLKHHPNIKVPADNETVVNPLGDWVEEFWESCNSDNPNLQENLERCLNKTVNSLAINPNLLNIDMFYEMSGTPKECFLEAVREVTGRDGIIIQGEKGTPKEDLSIYVVWNAEQIEIENIKDISKENQKIDIDFD